MTLRQMRRYLDAIGRAHHTNEAFRWGMHRNLAMALGVKAGDLREYPDYEGLEEGQLPDNWEEVAAASPAVIRVAATDSEPSTGDVQ